MRVGQARRRDGNETAIREALEDIGAAVLQVSEPGAADLLVLFRGRLQLLEVKQPGGRLTPAQQRRRREGWPIVVVQTEADALNAIGAVMR